MNKDHSSQRAFEERLESIPRVDLPADLRASVLANACPGGRGAVLSRFWNQSPKPVAAAIAAAWVVILSLQLTMPSGQDVQPYRVPVQTAAPDDSDRGERFLLAWAERQRLIEQSL